MSPTAPACRARLCCCKAATKTARVTRGLTGRRRSSFWQPACLPNTLSTVFDTVLPCRLRSQAQKPLCFCHQEKRTVVVGSTTSEKASKLIATGFACLNCITITTGHPTSHAGSGTVVYPNKDKYEGEWLNGKRHGIGALWLYDSDRYRNCYTGEWQRDKFHVSASSEVCHLELDLVLLRSRRRLACCTCTSNLLESHHRAKQVTRDECMTCR